MVRANVTSAWLYACVGAFQQAFLRGLVIRLAPELMLRLGYTKLRRLGVVGAYGNTPAFVALYSCYAVGNAG